MNEIQDKKVQLVLYEILRLQHFPPITHLNVMIEPNETQ